MLSVLSAEQWAGGVIKGSCLNFLTFNYVKPVMEYPSNVWAPYLMEHVNALEKVHKHFTKRMLLSLICPALSAKRRNILIS